MNTKSTICQGLTITQDQADNRGFKWSLSVFDSAYGASDDHEPAWKQEILLEKYNIQRPKTSGDNWQSYDDALLEGGDAYDKYVVYLMAVAKLESRGMCFQYGSKTDWKKAFIPAQLESLD